MAKYKRGKHQTTELYWKTRRLDNFETLDYTRVGFMPRWVYTRWEEFLEVRDQWKWTGYKWTSRED